MTDYDRMQKAVQTYFPSQNVTINVITNKMYITCDKIFSATLDFSRERSVLIEEIEILGFAGLYADERVEILDNMKYVVHAITSSLIRSRKALYIRRIYCKLKIFRDYLKEMYPRYMQDKEVTKTNCIKIDKLLNLEAFQFSYLDALGHLGPIKDKIKIGVEFFPVWYIGKFFQKFTYVNAIRDFNPYLQNLTQIKFIVDTHFEDNDKKIMYANILSTMDLNIAFIDKIIQNNFGGIMNATLFTHTKSLQRFDAFIAEKYNIHELDIWEYISTMEGLTEDYIDTHYSDLKPYFRDLLKNPELSLDFLKSHKKDIRRTGSYPIVLVFNKNIDREYLIKNSRRYKNAIIHRIALLKSGDEYLFHRYRRRLKWDLLKENYTGYEHINISKILNHAKKYLSEEERSEIKEINTSYISQMFKDVE